MLLIYEIICIITIVFVYSRLLNGYLDYTFEGCRWGMITVALLVLNKKHRIVYDGPEINVQTSGNIEKERERDFFQIGLYYVYVFAKFQKVLDVN